VPFTLAEIALAKQFLGPNHMCALACGLFDARQGFVQILARVVSADHLNQRHIGFILVALIRFHIAILTFSRRQTLSRYGGGFLRSAPSLISRRRYFPGVRPGSFEQILSCSLDIYRRVYVSVMVGAASRTIPLTYREK